MEAFAVVFIVLLIRCAFGAVCAAIASSKGRNAAGWFFAGLLIDCIAIIIILCLSNLKEEEARMRRMRNEQRRLREQLKQERMKNQAFQGHVHMRLDRHDEELGVDTRQLGPAPDEQLRLEEGFQDTSAPAGETPLTEREWYVKFGNRVSRALPFTRLQELYRAGNIDDDTLVRTGEGEEWSSLRHVPGLWEELNDDEHA